MSIMCQKCREMSPEDSKFCKHCGSPFGQRQEQYQSEPLHGDTQENQNPDLKTWWYVFEGTRNGPCTDEDMVYLIQHGTVQRKTQIWRAGMINWVEAEQSCFKNSFSVIPPQVSPEQINDKFAWALAVVPILASILLSQIFLGLGIYNNEISVFIAAVTIGLNSGFWIADKNLLKKAGYNSNGWMWTGLFLIPIYLFVRANKTNKQYWYAITWCILFILSYFIK